MPKKRPTTIENGRESPPRESMFKIEDNAKYSPSLCCEILDCGHTKFYSTINAGELIAHKDGHFTFVYGRDLRAYINRPFPKYQPKRPRVAAIEPAQAAV